MHRSLPTTVIAVLWLACACERGVATQVLVHIDADDTLKPMATRLDVVVHDDDGAPHVLPSLSLDGTASGSLPRVVPLSPRGGDAERRWAVTATLSGAAGRLGLLRARGGYVKGERREVWLIFSASCVDGPDCPGELETCEDGRCVSACVRTAADGTGPPTARVACPSTEDAGVDPGVDGGRDGGAGLDAGADASVDAGADAGCTGCTEGSECLPGDTVAACGIGGRMCVACSCSGDACTEGRCEPVRPVIQVAAGVSHTCAVTSGDDAIWCWGDADSDGLGVTLAAPTAIPQEVPGATDALGGVDVGHSVTCALGPSSRIHCWGRNDRGQLGVGSTDADRLRSPLAGTWQYLSVGVDHACATSGGAVECWGNDRAGQLGDGTIGAPSEERSPVPVDHAATLRFLAVGTGYSHTCALAEDGGIWCWGANNVGQYGQLYTPDGSPAHLGGSFAAGWTALAVGGFHTCALRGDGELRCWGGNLHGQIGDGASGPTVDRRTPVHVRPGTRFARVWAGRSHTCAQEIGSDTFLCWGRNEHLQLGVASTAPAVESPTSMRMQGWQDLALGENHTCGIRPGGVVYCWGGNDDPEDGEPDVRKTGAAGAGPFADAVRVCLPP